MKKIVFFALFLMLSIITVLAQGDKKIQLKNQIDSVSWVIGYDIGQNFDKQSIEINPDVLIRAISESMNGKPSFITVTESEKVIQDYVRTISLKKNQEIRKASENFLAENKKSKEVKVTASGLQYKVITEGTGLSPTLNDKVMVHYRGTLVDNTQFDASYDRGEPATFPLNGVIKGWQEGLQLMKEGGKSIFYIPSELGYGETGAGQSIPGGAALIFEVELIKVNPEGK